VDSRESGRAFSSGENLFKSPFAYLSGQTSFRRVFPLRSEKNFKDLTWRMGALVFADELQNMIFDGLFRQEFRSWNGQDPVGQQCSSRKIPNNHPIYSAFPLKFEDGPPANFFRAQRFGVTNLKSTDYLQSNSWQWSQSEVALIAIKTTVCEMGLRF